MWFGRGGQADSGQEGVGSDGGFDFGLVGGEFFGGPHLELRTVDCGLRTLIFSCVFGFPGGLLLAEVLRAFGQGEALFGVVLAVGVNVLFMSPQVQLMGVHLLVALVFAEFELALVFAVVGAGGEVGQALESEEAGGGVFAAGGEVVRDAQDGVVHVARDSGQLRNLVH
jgi:hypothetical protein